LVKWLLERTFSIGCLNKHKYWLCLQVGNQTLTPRRKVRCQVCQPYHQN